MILVYTEYNNGQFSKKSLEALSYAKALSDKVVALAINAGDVTDLQTYGAEKILTVTSDKLTHFSVKNYVALLLQVAQKEQVTTILLPSSANTRYLAPVLAVKWGLPFQHQFLAQGWEGTEGSLLLQSDCLGVLAGQASDYLSWECNRDQTSPCTSSGRGLYP